MLDKAVCNQLRSGDFQSYVDEDCDRGTAGTFNGVECARRSGEFERALTLLAIIEASSCSGDSAIQDAIQRQKQLITKRDTSPQPDDKVTHKPVVRRNKTPSEERLPQSEIVVEQELPSILIRGINFAAAIQHWTFAGFPTRARDEIDERVMICKACPLLVNDVCSKCGCDCSGQGVISKLALATETCPEGKWE